MAITPTYFSTPALVKERSYIDTNVEDSVLKVTMSRVQDLYIEPILGTPLFNKILADIKASTIAEPYVTLLNDYILPVYFAYCEYLLAPHLNNEFRNKAVGKSGDQDIKASTEAELNYVRASVMGYAKKYEARLIGHLKDSIEADTYPEYSDYDCAKQEQVKPMSNKYGRTLFLGK